VGIYVYVSPGSFLSILACQCFSLTLREGAKTRLRGFGIKFIRPFLARNVQKSGVVRSCLWVKEEENEEENEEEEKKWGADL